MSTFTTAPNQSLLDVAINQFGGIGAVMELCRKNNLPISSIPVPGTALLMPDADVTAAVTDKGVLAALKRHKLPVGTAYLVNEVPPGPDLTLLVVLEPKLRCSFLVVSGSDWALDWAETEGFEHRYDLLDDWLVTPTLRHIEKGAFDFMGEAGASDIASTAGTMTGMEMSFPLEVLSVGVGEVFMWYSVYDDVAAQVARFKDTEGNEASYAPFVAWDADTTTLYRIVGSIRAELTSATDTVATVTVTVGHAAIPDALGSLDIFSQTLYKVVEGEMVTLATVAGIGIEEVLELEAGSYELGVKTVYQSSTGSEDGPHSYVSVAIVIG